MTDEYRSQLESWNRKLRSTLTDAMVMFEQIERNRNMSPMAETLNQYIAMSREIRHVLQETKP